MLSGSTLLRHLAQFYCAIYRESRSREDRGIVFPDFFQEILDEQFNVPIFHLRAPLHATPTTPTTTPQPAAAPSARPHPASQAGSRTCAECV